MRHQCHSLAMGVLIGACCLLLPHAAGAESVPTKPLVIYAAAPVVNEFGEIIEGNASMPKQVRPLAQVLRAANGIFPPQPDGSPHPANPPVPGAHTHIGSHVSRSLERPGLFGAYIVDDRPYEGAIFVRVFNAPNIKESLFYGDSEVVQIDGKDLLYVSVAAIDQCINRHRDTDNDGVPDYWEHLHFGGGTVIEADRDYDGDGMTARMEYIAGTDPNDSDSRLVIHAVRRLPVAEGGGDRIEWPGVSGRDYTLECTTNLVSGTFAVVPQGTDVPATPPLNVLTNTQADNAPMCVYRLRVKKAPPDIDLE